MPQLKLIALDTQDLEIVSAHVQDAVIKVADLVYTAGDKRFVLAMNRFVWENRPGLFTRRHERRRAILHFEGVRSVKSAGFAREGSEDVLSLLAVRFEPAREAPSGWIDLTFSGGAAVRLEVDYVEARLSDLGAAWETGSRPVHRT